MGIGGKGRPLQRDGTIRTKVGRCVYMEISSAMHSRTWDLVENSGNGKVPMCNTEEIGPFML